MFIFNSEFYSALKMKNQKHFNKIMLFIKSKNACETVRKNKVYGQDTVSDDTIRKWFVKFQQCDFTLKDDARSGHPCIVDDDWNKLSPKILVR